MINMESIIAARNTKIIHEDPNPEQSKCNYRNKMECPMPGKCASKNIVYEAIVTSPTAIKKYIGYDFFEIQDQVRPSQKQL